MNENLDNRDVLLAKWLEGRLSDDEKVLLSEKYDLDNLSHTVEKVDQLSNPEYHVDEQWQKFGTRISNESSSPKTRMRRMVIASIAASLLIALSLSVWIFQKPFKISSGDQLVQHILPDGSQIELARASSISYIKKDWGKQRTVDLKGNALFDVQKGHDFAVNFSEGIVRVLGTRFSIEHLDGELAIKCFEGKVQVEMESGQSFILSQGDQVIKTAKGEITESETYLDSAHWANPSSRYRNISFSRLINILSEIYGIRFEYNIKNPPPFTGTIIHNDINSALQLSLGTIKIDYEYVDDDLIQLTESED